MTASAALATALCLAILCGQAAAQHKAPAPGPSVVPAAVVAPASPSPSPTATTTAPTVPASPSPSPTPTTTAATTVPAAVTTVPAAVAMPVATVPSPSPVPVPAPAPKVVPVPVPVHVAPAPAPVAPALCEQPPASSYASVHCVLAWQKCLFLLPLLPSHLQNHGAHASCTSAGYQGVDLIHARKTGSRSCWKALQLAKTV